MQSSVPVARAVQGKLCPTVSAWGMTEVGGCAALGSPIDDEERRCTDSGAPLPGYEFRIVDPERGGVLGAGEIGELQCRSYMLLSEYYRDREATAAAYSEDGWFRTGDRVLLHEDGSIRFLGRYKDVLKVGGENVDPFEVEAFLKTHPAVAQVQVVAAPDARLSEVPVAFVIPRPGRGSGPGGPAGLLPRRDCGLQDPAPVLPRERVPDDRERKGAAFPPPRRGGAADARGGTPTARLSGGASLGLARVNPCRELPSRVPEFRVRARRRAAVEACRSQGSCCRPMQRRRNARRRSIAEAEPKADEKPK